MSNRNSPNTTPTATTMMAASDQKQQHNDQSSLGSKAVGNNNLHQKTDSSSSRTSTVSSQKSSSSSAATCPPNSDTLILLTPYPVEPGHTLITIARLSAAEWRPEMRSSAAYVAEGDNAGIIINKPASIMDYNKVQAGQKERQQLPSAKMSFKVFLINSETNKLALEHRTLRFWLDHSPVISQQKPKNNGSRTTGGGDNNHQDGYAGDDNDDDNDDGTNQHKSLVKSMRSFANLKQESSQLAQAYFCQLIGSKADDFPKNYVGFIMKLMRLLKGSQFARIIKMEVELRQLAQEDQSAKPPSPVSSIDGSQSGRGSPLTSQKVLDIIESSYPNPISIREICSSTQTDEPIVRQLVDELASREKISSTDEGHHYTRTTKPIDTKVNMVKQMPKVTRSQQPVIAIITAQYCEKLAVDSMISDKETFVRYRVGSGGQDSSSSVESSSNYVYTLGNIGDHRVVSTKLTSIGHSRGALIAAGNATTRLLGTFPEVEYVFLVGCGGGVPNYTDFSSHVRLGDIVISHLPGESDDYDRERRESLDDANLSRHQHNAGRGLPSPSSDFVYVHCRPKLQQEQGQNKKSSDGIGGSNIPVSYSIHKNLKRAGGGGGPLNGSTESTNQSNNKTTTTTIGSDDQAGGGDTSLTNESNNNNTSSTKLATADKQLTYEECHFRLWRPARLDLQELAQRLWFQGLEEAKHRIWDYYIDDGIKTLKQQDIEASRPIGDTDKLFMSIGMNDTIEVSHPEAADDEVDLRREGRPMCHFGPIGSGRPALGSSDKLKQQMISEFNLRAFDSEFDPVVESIYGNCKESYIMIRGISDYKDGRKKKEWQQYSALVAAAFMKSIIVNLKPVN